jgi:hypothetical protein
MLAPTAAAAAAAARYSNPFTMQTVDVTDWAVAVTPAPAAPGDGDGKGGDGKGGDGKGGGGGKDGGAKGAAPAAGANGKTPAGGANGKGPGDGGGAEQAAGAAAPGSGRRRQGWEAQLRGFLQQLFTDDPRRGQP